MLTRESFYINLSYILFLLIPLSLLTGPFFPDFFVVIIDIIFITYSIKNKKWIYFKNIFFYIFLIFYFYIIFVSLFSDAIFDSLKSSLPYIRFGIFPLAVYCLIDKKNNVIKYFYVSLLITFSCILVDGYYQFLFGQNLFGYTGEGVRMTLLLDDRLELGGYLVRLFPLLIGLAIYTNVEIHKLSYFKIFFFISFFILTLILIFLSGERTAIALSILSIIYILIMSPKYKKVILTIFLLLILFFSFIIFTNENLRERNITNTLNGLGITNTEGVEFSKTTSIIIFTPIYQSHILGAFKMFKKNPIIGVGPDQFRNLCHLNEYNVNYMTCSTHPHNIYVQLLAETGIIGILIFSVPLVYILIISIKQIMNIYFKNNLHVLSGYQMFILLCFLISLWPIAPTHNVFNNWINIIFFLPVGFYLQYIYSNKSR